MWKILISVNENLNIINTLELFNLNILNTLYLPTHPGLLKLQSLTSPNKKHSLGNANEIPLITHFELTELNKFLCPWT